MSDLRHTHYVGDHPMTTKTGLTPLPVVRIEQLDGSHEHPVVRELRAEIERLRFDTQEWVTENKAAHEEIAQLKTEIERLRIIAADYQALQHRANEIDDHIDLLLRGIGGIRDYLDQNRIGDASFDCEALLAGSPFEQKAP